MTLSKFFTTNLKNANVSINSSLNSLSIESTTKRLFIRSYLDIDFDDCLLLYSDKELTKYFDHGEPRNRKEVLEFTEERGRKYFDNGEPYGLFSVFLKDDQTFIGQVDLVPADNPGEVEIGWIFHKNFHNKGYCSEAILEFLLPFVYEIKKNDFKANNSPISRIIATAHPENIPSNKMIQKAGLSLYQFQLRYGGKPRNWYCLNLI